MVAMATFMPGIGWTVLQVLASVSMGKPRISSMRATSVAVKLISPLTDWRVRLSISALCGV